MPSLVPSLAPVLGVTAWDVQCSFSNKLSGSSALAEGVMHGRAANRKRQESMLPATISAATRVGHCSQPAYSTC